MSSSVINMAMDLDRDSPVPLFEQLAALLKAEFDAGRMTVRVPSEISLTQQHGVSRDTAHRAVMILVNAGYARISRGKGTYVVPKAERG